MQTTLPFPESKEEGRGWRELCVRFRENEVGGCAVGVIVAICKSLMGSLCGGEYVTLGYCVRAVLEVEFRAVLSKWWAVPAFVDFFCHAHLDRFYPGLPSRPQRDVRVMYSYSWVRIPRWSPM